MNVFEHVKQGYTFNDFYLKPSKSKAKSRRDLSIESCLTPGLLFDFPVIPANMASISGSRMAVALLQAEGTCCLHRFLTPEKLIEELKFISAFQSNEGMWGSRDFANKSMTVGISLGTNPESNSEFLSILNKYSGLWNSIGYIIIDVAHGHHSNVISTIETLVSYFKNNQFDSSVFPPKIIAGNICTAYAAKELSLYPIDGLKVGIGPGCFVSGTKVILKNSIKEIQNIKVGDEVLTHKGRYRNVIATTQRKEFKKVHSINGIKCTENHEFYVLEKKYKDIVNDGNINEYAEWISAKSLDKDKYFLLKIKE